MEITHICQTDTGGAFEVARRLSFEQNSAGHSSNLLILFKEKSYVNRILYKVLSKIDYEIGRLSKSPLTITVFKGIAISVGIRKALRKVEIGTVVHLHWLPGLSLFYPNKLLSNFKVVWTIHDTEPLTGICHNNFHCTEFTRSCSGCFQISNKLQYLPELILRAKKRNLRRDNRSILIFPSNWLKNMALKNDVFVKKRMCVIPNPVAPEINEITETHWVGTRFKNGLTPRIGIIGSNYDESKGTKEVVRVIQELDFEFELMTIGIPHPELRTSILEVMPHSKSEKIFRAMSTCDIFLYLSKAESFGNIVAEAQYLGIPVVTLKVGGIPEIVFNGRTGFLVTNLIEAESRILELLNDDLMRENFSIQAKKLASESYELKRIHELYLQLYLQA